MKITEILPGIDQNPIFKGVSHSALNRYLAKDSIMTKAYEAGTTVHSSESGAIRIGIVLSGSARVYTANSERTLLRTMGKGNMFGIANLYAGEEPFPSVIEAAEPCRVLWIDCDAFRALIEENKTALRNYLAFQSRKIVYLNRKIMTFTAGSAEKKLALFLEENQVDGVVSLPCSMSRLAELLCMGRASLYRAIDRLEELGIIEKQEKILRILEHRALTEMI